MVVGRGGDDQSPEWASPQWPGEGRTEFVDSASTLPQVVGYAALVGVDK